MHHLIIYAASSEEFNLYRYSLRFNSTRMRRGAWQSKNLPRGENSPWMATFLSTWRGFIFGITVGTLVCVSTTLTVNFFPLISLVIDVKLKHFYWTKHLVLESWFFEFAEPRACAQYFHTIWVFQVMSTRWRIHPTNKKMADFSFLTSWSCFS